MINSKELRIGNLISYNNQIFEIQSISIRGIESMKNILTGGFIDAIQFYDKELLDGISIDSHPYFLEMNGFEEAENLLYIFDNSFQFEYHILDNELVVKDVHYDCTIKLIENPKIHELQNLYFALTGKELITQNR